MAKKIAIVEFNGDWDEKSIDECLDMMKSFNYSENQALSALTLTDEGVSVLCNTLFPKIDEEKKNS